MSTKEQREPQLREWMFFFSFIYIKKKKFKIYFIVVSQRLGDDDAAGRWEGLPEIISQEINHTLHPEGYLPHRHSPPENSIFTNVRCEEQAADIIWQVRYHPNRAKTKKKKKKMKVKIKNRRFLILLGKKMGEVV